jgi:choline-sulfatase
MFGRQGVLTAALYMVPRPTARVEDVNPDSGPRRWLQPRRAAGGAPDGHAGHAAGPPAHRLVLRFSCPVHSLVSRLAHDRGWPDVTTYHLNTRMRPRRPSWLLLLTLLAGCGGSPPPEPQRRDLPPRGALVGPPRHVVLVTVDTLRASNLGSYGYGRDTSPFIDRLAREGVQFLRAYSPVPRTAPAHMSIMTGLRPHAHGAMRNRYAISRPDVPSLPAFFRSRGYATAAFVSVPFLNPDLKKLPGFEYVEAPQIGHMFRAKLTLRRAATWVRSHADEAFFLWVHLFDPHKPYDPHESYRRMFWPGPPLDYKPPTDGLLTGPPPTPREVEFTNALYDGEIRYTDQRLRLFFEELSDYWIAPPLIVFMADHGEVLDEHAVDFQHVYFHGKYPFNTSIRVPLIVHWPEHLAAATRRSPIDITGIGPTLADVLFGGGFTGQVESFAETLTKDAPGAPSLFAFSPKLYPEEEVPPQWEFRRKEAWSILRWPWHLIYHPDRKDLLFNVESDPLERENLAAVHPDRAHALREEVIRHFRTLPKVEPGVVPVDERLREQLRSLGYAN